MTRIPGARSTVPNTRDLDDEEAAGVARALAHPVRVRILRILLRERECYCGDLCEEFSLAQSTVSQHLKVLREAGLIRGTRCGTAVGYCVDEDRLAAFREWANHLEPQEAETGALDTTGRRSREAVS
jgi:DNA-binding transcriptional ArsR family regulator